jgi:hypothetical protein
MSPKEKVSTLIAIANALESSVDVLVILPETQDTASPQLVPELAVTHMFGFDEEE